MVSELFCAMTTYVCAHRLSADRLCAWSALVLSCRLGVCGWRCARSIGTVLFFNCTFVCVSLFVAAFHWLPLHPCDTLLSLICFWICHHDIMLFCCPHWLVQDSRGCCAVVEIGCIACDRNVLRPDFCLISSWTCTGDPPVTPTLIVRPANDTRRGDHTRCALSPAPRCDGVVCRLTPRKSARCL